MTSSTVLRSDVRNKIVGCFCFDMARDRSVQCGYTAPAPLQLKPLTDGRCVQHAMCFLKSIRYFPHLQKARKRVNLYDKVPEIRLTLITQHTEQTYTTCTDVQRQEATIHQNSNGHFNPKTFLTNSF